jgi:hypothetical protein
MKRKVAVTPRAAQRVVVRAVIVLMATLLLLAIFRAHVVFGQSQAPAYVSEFPSVDRVMKEMEASDPDETAARQMAAFWQLKQMIENMAGPRFYKPGLTPEEAKLRQAYYTAYYQIMQTKPEFKSFTAMRGYDVSDSFRNDLIKRLFPPNFAAEYAKATGQANAQFQALHKARLDAENREAENQRKAAEAAQQQIEAEQTKKTATSKEEREFNRCVESGRGELQCMAEGLGKGINGMIGQIAPGYEIPTPPPGLRLNGSFTAQTGAHINFNSEVAMVGCYEVAAAQAYKVEVKNNQIEVRTSDDKKTVVLAYKTDGKLVGSGPITITGKVPEGTSTQTTYGSTTTTTTEQKQISQGEAWQYSPSQIHQNGQEYSVDQPTTHTTYGPTGTTTTTQYASRTKSCTLGVMTPHQSDDAALYQVMGMLDSSSKKGPLPIGLRMNGTYAGSGGLEIEFQPDSAEIQCGDAVLAMPYAVERKENQIVVNIKDAAAPVALTLGADGKLSGSGQIQVIGRRGSRSCPLGVLAANEAGAGGAAGAKSSVAAAKPTATAAPSSSTPATNSKSATGSAGSAATQPAATPNAPTGNALLSIAGKFDLPAGAPNPIVGHTFVLLRDNYETTLAKGGFQIPAGMTPAKATAQACANKAPDCQTAAAAINANSAAGVRMDATGKAAFPGVPAGSYFLIGSMRYNNQFLYWDLPVELKAGANSITLDPSNAKPADR